MNWRKDLTERRIVENMTNNQRELEALQSEHAQKPQADLSIVLRQTAKLQNIEEDRQELRRRRGL